MVDQRPLAVEAGQGPFNVGTGRLSERYGLTSRELDVLVLVAEGRADKEIAAKLSISPLTVHRHVSNILRKMACSSRTEAATRSLREGLLK